MVSVSQDLRFYMIYNIILPILQNPSNPVKSNPVIAIVSDFEPVFYFVVDVVH